MLKTMGEEPEMTKQMRTLGTVVLAATVLAALFGQAEPAAAAGATLRMAPAVYVGPASGTFTINVYANTNQNQMRGYEFGLTYDPTKIDITAIAEGPFMKNWATANGCSTTSATGGWDVSGNSGTVAPAGYVVMGCAGPPPIGVVGEGIIAVITVQALSATSGGTALQFNAGAFLMNENAEPITPLTKENSTLWLGEQPPMPDLVIESLTVKPSAFDPAKYKVEAKVKNQGGAAAAASKLEVKIDGTTFETLDVSALAVGASATVETANERTLTPDSDTIQVCADSQGTVVEINEGNNCADTAYSLISDTDQVDTDVNADLKKYISLRAPKDIQHTEWNLKIGANAKSDNGTDGLGVKSNGNWVVSATDLDTTNTNGRMRQFNGTSFGTFQLAAPLHVVAENDVTLPTLAPLQTGGPNVNDDWQNFNVTFTQMVGFKDRALQNDWYHIVVTFIGTTSF